MNHHLRLATLVVTLSWLVILTIAPAHAQGTVIASDNFDRPDESPFAVGGNWGRTIAGNYDGVSALVGNQVTSVSNEGIYYWQGPGTFDSTRQFARQRVVETNGEVGLVLLGGPDHSIMVGWGPPGANSTVYIYWYSDGLNRDVLGTGSSSLASGDIIEAVLDGGMIHARVNGVTVKSVANTTTLTSGAPGFITYLDPTKPGFIGIADDWEAGTPAAYTISGTIMENAAGLGGAVVTASGGFSGSATTDGDGVYTIAGVPSAATSILLTPTLAGHTMSPLTRTVAGPVTGNLAGEDFTSTPKTSAVLTIQATDGSVTKDPDQPTYTLGTEVTLTPVPAAGHGFAGWSGDVPAGHELDTPLHVTMDDDRTIAATFLAPGVVAVDHFDRADESPLVLGGNWQQPFGGGHVALTDNRIVSASGEALYYWQGPGTFDDTRQFARGRVVQAGGQAGLVLLGASDQALVVSWGGGRLYIYWYANGNYQGELANEPSTLEDGDLVEAVLDSGTVHAKINGVTVTSVVNTTSLSAGRPGFETYQSGAVLDDWEAGIAPPAPLAGSALRFNGLDQYLTFGQAPELGAPRFTLELWFKRTGAGVATATHPGGGGVVAVPLLTKGRHEADGDTRDANYFLGIDADGHVVAEYEEDAGQLSPGLNHSVTGSTVIGNDAWYHAAAVFDGASLRLYVNGHPDGVTSGLAGREPRSNSIHEAALGTAFNTTGPAGYFAGDIDEPRIWSVARSECEIVAGMNAEIASGTGLVGRWGLNEESPTIAPNSVGGSPVGTLANGPSWVPNAPFDLPPPVVGVPLAPSALAAAAPDAHQVLLNWTDNATSEAGFEIERSTSGTAGPFLPLAVLGPNTLAYTDAVLDPATEYAYRVRALNCAGSSGYCEVAAATTTLELCNALAFTPGGAGTGAFVALGNSAALRLSEFTLEMWVRRDGAGNATATAPGGIADAIPLIARGRSEDQVAAHDVNYFLGIRQSDGVLVADFEEGSTGPTPGASHPVTGTTAVTMGAWHHVAATYDGSTWKLYLNGSLDAQLEVGRPVASASTAAVAMASALNSANEPAGQFDGAIDEVRIWDHARTQAEIQGTMLQLVASPAPGLAGRWGLDEGAGNTAYGTAESGIHGSIVGSEDTTWTRTGCASWTLGIVPDQVSELALSPVTPNPVRERARFRFALPRGGSVKVEILDLQGRRLAVLADGELGAGRHDLTWNRQSGGGGVTSGVYFVRLQALDRVVTRRFVVTR